MKKIRVATMAGILALSLVLAVFFPVLAGSTTKSLSTNFTIVNLGSGPANGVVQYLKPDGTGWKSPDNFTISAPGGQLVFRQYADNALSDGRGSVVISADQPLGTVVQIQARGQTPTSGAYSGFLGGSRTFYVPLVARQRGTASGIANSQIVVQNTGSMAVNVEVDLVSSDGTIAYTKTGIYIQPGAAYLYDLADETNLPVGWIGSAVVRAATTDGRIAVVSNFFTGPHGMQTFNAFPEESPSEAWVVPLFVSRLSVNGLSAPVTIQNLDSTSIPAGSAVMTCTVDATSPSQSPATFVVTNTSPISPSASYAWNPVVDTRLPSNWLGACRVTAPGQVVSFVQLRFIGTDKAAAYEAINANSTDKTVVVPLVAKRLLNGFATAVTIQNLSVSASATVTLTYLPAPESGSPATLQFTTTIAPSGSLIQNHRVHSSHPQGVNLPDGWQGTLTVVSDQPIGAFVQLDFLGQPGDPYMAHVAFTKP